MAAIACRQVCLQRCPRHSAFPHPHSLRPLHAGSTLILGCRGSSKGAAASARPAGRRPREETQRSAPAASAQHQRASEHKVRGASQNVRLNQPRPQIPPLLLPPVSHHPISSLLSPPSACPHRPPHAVRSRPPPAREPAPRLTPTLPHTTPALLSNFLRQPACNRRRPAAPSPSVHLLRRGDVQSSKPHDRPVCCCTSPRRISSTPQRHWRHPQSRWALKWEVCSRPLST